MNAPTQNVVPMAALPDAAPPRHVRRRQPDKMRGDSGTLLAPRVVAAMLGVAVDTLRTWRHQRRGPDYVKDKATLKVWYYEDVIDAWRRENFSFVDL